MDTSNIVALVLGGIGFIISIVGLVVTPILNLKSKRLEKRLEHRFILFHKILELWEFTHTNQSPKHNEFEPFLKEVNKLIQLYGYNSEIKAFKKATKSYNNFAEEGNETNRQKLITDFNNFFSISFNAYRKEIILDKLED